MGEKYIIKRIIKIRFYKKTYINIYNNNNIIIIEFK